MISIDFTNLAYNRAFNFIPSQDPNVSLRFCLPIPNWLNRDGQPMKTYRHDDIVFDAGKGGYRFRFVNMVDGKREQRVKIDGSGVIVMAGLNVRTFDALMREIIVATRGVTRMKAKDVARVLHIAELHGVRDFYNSNAADIEARFWAYRRPNPASVFGGFIPHPHVSSAIGYKGPVRFNILASGSQTHSMGGFVTFPTLTAAEVMAAGKKGIAELCQTRGVTPRAVESFAFRAKNTLPDGKPVPVPAYRPRFRTKKLAPGG